MALQALLSPFKDLQDRITALEQAMSRRSSMLTFLVVRFVLMSAMVVGFTWYSFELRP